jgi:hypothetical protein
MTDPQTPPADPNVDPPAETPPAGTPPAAGDPPKNDPPKNDDGKGEDGKTDAERGYPKDVDVNDMTDKQQAAFWKSWARKHETGFKTLAGKDMTPEQVAQLLADKEKADREAMSAQEQAVADARKEAREEALTEGRKQTVRSIMDAHIAASGLDKAKPEDQDVIDAVQALDPSSFIKDDQVDADRLTKVLARIVPAKGTKQNSQWPATGQGNQQIGTGSAKDAGKAEAERRGYVKTGDA